MGIRSRERRMRVLLVLALLCVVVAHGDPEVETLDNYRQGFASVPAAKVALTPGQEALNPDELLEIAQAAEPSAGVVELTKKIKGIQGDIKSVENKADEASADSSKAEEKAAASGPGAKKDAAMKDHIDSGAAAEDAKADLEDKKKQLVDLTIKQHDESKKSAVEANGAASASSDSDSDSDSDGSSDSFSSGSVGGYGESGAADTGPLFENWLSTFDEKHGDLVRTVQQAFSFSQKIMDGMRAKKEDVHSHMRKVKAAYDKETKERIAAQERAKEFKEKLKAAKAAEKKAKAAEKSTKDKMQEELQKADEKEKKAKEQITKLQEENQKIRDDCEKKTKEMSKKAKERLKKSKEKTAKETARANKLAQELEAAKEKISELAQELEAAKAKIAKLEAVVAKQKEEIEHHKAQERKEKKSHKDTREKLAKAEEKIETLKEKLAQVVAKYNKIKDTLSHINTVSGQPHRK